MTDANAKKVIAICDDMGHALKDTKNALEQVGYQVLTFRAFPTEYDMLPDGSDLNQFNKTEWLTGYFTDFQQFIDAVRNPREALGRDDLPDHVDMVISDGQMAYREVNGSLQDDMEKSGIELCVRMCEAGLQTPIAISTAAAGGHVARTGMSQELGRLAEKRGLDGESMRENVPIVAKDPEAFLKIVEEKIGFAHAPEANAKEAGVDDAQHVGVIDSAQQSIVR